MNKLLIVLLMLSFLWGGSLYAFRFEPLDTAQMYVLPDTQPGQEVGSTFKDSVCYIKGTTSPTLWNWGAGLEFDPTVLQCDSVKKGPLTDLPGSVWAQYIDNAWGAVRCGNCLFQNPPVDGSGTLCYIFWRVIGDRGSMLYMDTAWCGTWGGDDHHKFPCTVVDGYYKPPILMILYPNGEEWLTMGTSTTIKWVSAGVISNVKLDLYRGNDFYANIVSNTSNDSSELWLIPTSYDVGTNYKVKITSLTDTTVYDFSNCGFRLGQKIEVLVPSGGEIWYKGNTYEIKWMRAGGGGRVSIHYYNGIYWDYITHVDDIGIYSWTIPTYAHPTDSARIRIVHCNYPANSDTSNTFTIAELPGIEESKAESQKLGAEIFEIYPNPFNKKTIIKIEVRNEKRGARSSSYSLPNSQFSILIYDLTGRVVRSFPLNTNYSLLTTVVWDGKDANGKYVESGIYFCQLRVGNNNVTRKMVVVR
ncbi:MAG: T9SS type A sorting domain-containing protein [bacterium]|nr:T9SS type A sorting domain-containing protein [bacterium]